MKFSEFSLYLTHGLLDIGTYKKKNWMNLRMNFATNWYSALDYSERSFFYWPACLNKCHLVRFKNEISWFSTKKNFVGFKGSQDPIHFIFEINVGKSRIRHITTLNLNDNRFSVDLEIHHSISESLYVGSDSCRHWFQK